MISKNHNSLFIVVIAIVAIALTHMFTIGYGVGFQKRGKIMLAMEQAKQYTSSHLTVHYERKMHDKQDILRLEIDTTYRQIGKGAFTYEVICDRTIALHSSGEYAFPTNEARQCFVEGATRKWVKQNRHHSIEGYHCWTATTMDNNTSWLAWYTTELPHCAEGATISDGLKGLILHVEDSKGEYRLHATKIDVKIG